MRSRPFYGPDSVFDTSPMGLGTYEGLAAISSFDEDWVGVYDEFTIDAEEVVDLGHGVVFAAVVQSGRPTGSSGHVKLHYAAVIEFQRGKVMRITNYTDIDQARATAERLVEERR